MKPSPTPPTEKRIEDASGPMAREASRRRWLPWIALLSIVLLLAAGAYLAARGWLEARDSPREKGGAASSEPPTLSELESRANQAIDRVEARWAKARDDVRAGLLPFDAAMRVLREECSAPLEEIAARLRPAGPDPYASEAVRRERLLGRVNAQLLTMDNEAVSMTKTEQDRANEQMDRLREGADRELEAIRRARAEGAAKDAAGMGADGK